MSARVSILASIIFMLSLTCATADSGAGTVTGRLMLSNGKPLSRGQVFFFDVNSPLEKPVVGRFWRVPDAVEHVDMEGRFSIQLDEGSYYIGAIKRFSSDKLGPPEIGDYFLPSHDSQGKYRVITVKNNSTTNIGTIKGLQRYSSNLVKFKGRPTKIEGRITSASGQPVKGMYVLAYTDPSMQGRPSFVSGSSDADGTYRLLVDKGRTFYLKVRDMIAGGRPQSGNLLGVYGAVDAPASVEAKTNSTVSGIDITVDAFTSGREQ